MSDSIKPCPFCDRPNSQTVECGVGDVSWVSCICDAAGPVQSYRSEAIAAWNAAPRMTPAERAVLDDAVEFGDASKAMREAGSVVIAKVGLELSKTLYEKQKALHGSAKLLARERRGGSDG